MNLKPYFGMSRVMYLQSLANKYGDFQVSWNWYCHTSNEWLFTKRRTVLELWSEEYEHPSKCRLDKVQHRQAMINEIFVEIDDVHPISFLKKQKCIDKCKTLGYEYCVYKSRKGYHISVIVQDNTAKRRRDMILYVGSDAAYLSHRATWSMEWTNHWKQPDFVIEPVEISKNYVRKFIG